MKSPLGLCYTARMRGAHFTAEVLQQLIIGCRKVTLESYGRRSAGAPPYKDSKEVSITSTEMTFCPIHTVPTKTVKSCQFQLSSETLNSLFLNPKRLLFHPVCKKASAL